MLLSPAPPVKCAGIQSTCLADTQKKMLMKISFASCICRYVIGKSRLNEIEWRGVNSGLENYPTFKLNLKFDLSNTVCSFCTES